MRRVLTAEEEMYLTEKERELTISREEMLERWRRFGKRPDIATMGTGRESDDERIQREYEQMMREKEKLRETFPQPDIPMPEIELRDSVAPGPMAAPPVTADKFRDDLHLTADLDILKEAYVRLESLSGKKKPEEIVNDPKVELDALKFAFNNKRKMASKEAVAALEKGIVPQGVSPKLPDLEKHYAKQAEERQKKLALEVYNRAEARMEQEYDRIWAGQGNLTYNKDTEEEEIDNAEIEKNEKIMNEVVDLLQDMHVPEPSEEAVSLLKKREGFRDHVYLDSRDNPTAGHGHLLTTAERKKYPVGTKIPQTQIEEWFEQDTRKAHEAAIKQAQMLGDERLVDSLFQVNFQLGTNWYKKFTKTWKFLEDGEYSKAAVEAADSNWFKQTPVRVYDFQNSLRKLDTASPAARRVRHRRSTYKQ